MMENIYIPRFMKITEVIQETPDVRTFLLSLKGEEWSHNPGQFVELSVLGAGEIPIGIASSPTQKEYLRLTVRSVGQVSRALHEKKKGDLVGIRGPYGKPFPYDEVAGKDILFIGGGIGLPPLRSLLDYVLDERKKFGKIFLLYGARTSADRVYKDALAIWKEREDLVFHETVDVADAAWKGNVGVVTTLFPKIKIEPDKTVAYTCGPPIMIKFVIQELLKMGFPEENIVTTLERHMKCGVGKCGHCAIGHKYVCVDGPVFNYKQIKNLPESA